jgi:MinD superfamily P-loop ATPase
MPSQRAGETPATPPKTAANVSWIPWFPVIDYDRCTNCRQCLGFCLFGVYVSENSGPVRVANPTRCKTNCPACARTCPQVAIMFPKYSEGPISGREVLPEDLARGDLRVKPARQRADIQAALRERGGR